MPILEVGVEYIHIPVVPHKAVAEVSKIGNHRRDWLLWIRDGRVNHFAWGLLSFSLFLSVSLSLSLIIYLPTYWSICLPIYLKYCETSFKKWKVECSADSLVPMRFAIFLLHLSKVLRLPRKIDARSYEVLHLSRKIILANLQIWCSKMQPLSGNERPDLLTSLMSMSFVLRLPRKMHLCRSSSKVPCLPSFLDLLQDPHVLLTFDRIDNPLHLPRGTTSQRPKVVRTTGVFHTLTWKCASRHNGVHFFDISTSKSGPTLKCFVHFDLEMCFAPQRRALFRHLNFQKWSENGVLCTFSLRNVLRATAACNFSSLIWPAGSAPAALASLLFDPPEPQIIGKTQCFATFLPFRASASSFFWLFLFYSSLF